MTTWVLRKLFELLGGLHLGFVTLICNSTWPGDSVLFDGFDPVALGFVIDFKHSFFARFLTKERLPEGR